MAFSYSSTIRGFLCLSVLVLVICFASARHLEYNEDDLASEDRLLQLFEKWATKHSKNYTSPHESSQKHSRFQVFKQNLAYIHQQNSNKQKESSHRLGLTRFADLTLNEFKARHFGFRNRPSPVPLQEYSSVCDTKKLPASVDWRKHGAVTPVKDQGTCGSCWAFSSVGAIEGAHAIAIGELVSLSEQELVSCVHTNFGCHGGLMNPAFKWVIRNGGINTEEGYPYVSGTGRTRFCNWNKKMGKSVTIAGYEDVQPHNEEALTCAVAQQPVSVAINANSQDFQLYAGGIFNSCSDGRTDIDHAVLVVGYGSEGGKDYWIVKNSWTEDWGLDGYVHIERSTGNRRGVCGIHTSPSYPVVRKAASWSSM
ncbi:hypothetical protein GOP47_0002544 [Adiantum capillus-veneris]|uniref:Uncharacterized protein n=1 Tax=Adiantum capillus-veneris TaxID=13818 RepID=A0A9D4VAA1_ADICA|nr:hypothetical protein GOP47_0002544 [Adiantum capillus-veneris]